jgi:epoxyqueuosine reductase
MEFTGGAEVTTEAVLQGLPAAHHPGFWTRREDAIARQVGGQDDGVDDEADLAGRPWPAGSLKLRATCGQCTRCLDGCPAGAFVGPYHLDPQRCISYWTIESQQAIPRKLRPLFGNRIFGCDICQEVCPYNRQLAVRTPLLAGLHAQPDRIAPPLLDGFDPAQPYWLESTAFSARFRRSPIKRARRHGMLRNVCVALGNWADPIAIAPLTLALHDSHPLARGHAAWALGRVLARHGEERAGQALWTALSAEADARVAEEIRLALQG